MGKDLSSGWIEQNLDQAKRELETALEEYRCLENKDAPYAKGILKIISARLKIVDIWSGA